jgi:hypothetical protein
MGDQFLEQRISFKFCVKLGENASDTCPMLSEAYEGGSAGTWKMMKEVIVKDLTEPIIMLKNCEIWCIQIDEV